MTTNQIKAIREKTLAALDHVYTTRVYQYWINGSGQLCRSRREELDTVDCPVEILD